MFWHKLDRHNWNLPLWYIIGIFVFNAITFGIFYIARGSNNLFLAGLLDIGNILLLITWLIINLLLLLKLIRTETDLVNFIFPIYFSAIDIYILITYYLAWFKNIYLSVGTAKFISFLSTSFELIFASLFLYMIHRQSKKVIPYGKLHKKTKHVLKSAKVKTKKTKSVPKQKKSTKTKIITKKTTKKVTKKKSSKKRT
jgi:hypothetical protein